jgi:hypothetical protein
MCARLTRRVYIYRLSLTSTASIGRCEEDGAEVNLTDTGVCCLVDLPALAHLNLEGQLKMTDRGVEMLAGCSAECGACPALTSLTLRWSTTLTNASMWALRQLTSLTTLDISACNIDDVGMLSLSSHPVLTSLHISFTAVTDEGLRALALLPKLTSLNIEECEHITDMGVAALPPRVKVLPYDEW